MKRIVLSAAVLATLALAACGGSSNDNGATTPPPAPMSTTVSALAVSSIDKGTCDNGTPLVLNGTSFTDDQQQTDVTTLKPACTP